MAHFRGKNILKLEFSITIIILLTAVMFSVESRDLFVESILEQNYEELSVYKDSFDLLEKDYPGDSELLSAIESLESLDTPDFVLHNDVQLGIAQAYRKLGEDEQAEEILIEIINGNSDRISTADAVFELSEMYDEEELYQDSIDQLESHVEYFSEYRKSEFYFQLGSHYAELGNLDKAGEYMIKVISVEEDDQDTYYDIVSTNWNDYSEKNQLVVLDTLANMDMYKEYAEFAEEYISEHLPVFSVVEELALELVYNSSRSYVTDFIEFLGEYEEYERIHDEMSVLNSLSGNSIDSDSGAVRGLYYYRKLDNLNGLYTYSASSAMSYYEDYLDGDMDFDYTVLNLTLAIRNLLAYKEYEDITNIVEDSYRAHNLNQEIGILDRNISFWNGFAQYTLENYKRALQEFENAISVRPDCYYAMAAREYILEILDIQGISLEEYLSTLDYKYISNPETFTKLHYAKILYSFREGYGKQILRDKIVELTRKFSDDYIFDLDENQIYRFRMSENYIRFVIYTRYGFLEKARAILSSSGIDDEQVQTILIAMELTEEKKFSEVRDMMVEMYSERFINNNFAFLSSDIRRLFLPRPYDTEIEMALEKLDEPLVDEYLVYSIIRQESMYISDARSWAGAKGLMQLMPATASWVASKVYGTSTVDSYNTINNITLGTRYINDNVSSYGFMTAIAAYNSGYTIIRKTNNKYDPDNEYILLEIIPYTETRNYLRKVLTHYYRYRALYENDGIPQLSETLARSHV